jgi:hypothetical protein
MMHKTVVVAGRSSNQPSRGCEGCVDSSCPLGVKNQRHRPQYISSEKGLVEREWFNWILSKVTMCYSTGAKRVPRSSDDYNKNEMKCSEMKSAIW